MWLKEEFIGLEECFKLTHLVLDIFAKAMIDGRDSSIEQYLLNFWCKDLSLRDLVDHIFMCYHSAPELKSDIFNILFSWVVNAKLINESESNNNWNLEDFRKVASMKS